MSGPIGLGLGNGGPSLAELIEVPAQPQNPKYNEVMRRLPKQFLWKFIGAYNYYVSKEDKEAFLQRVLDVLNRGPAASSRNRKQTRRTRKNKQIK
jgi:hypothetical protein